MPTAPVDCKNRSKFSVRDFGMSICEPADILWNRYVHGKNAGSKQLRRLRLSDVESLLLRGPERGQFDSLGHRYCAEVCGLAAFVRRHLALRSNVFRTGATGPKSVQLLRLQPSRS